MKKTPIVLPLIVFISLLFISCNFTDKQQTKKSQHEEKAQKAKKKTTSCDDVHWSHHKGENGPENWGNLCEGFKDCNGDRQSPVNITDVQVSDTLQPLDIYFGKSKISIINNGHTVQFNVDEGSYIVLNDKKYALLQFHYHATSEHTIDGEYFPLEVHFVLKHNDKDLAVIGAMYEKGTEKHQLFTRFLDKFPTKKGQYKSDEEIKIANILPEKKDYYYYTGSLTTPPCSEVVTWIMLQKPILASEKQIDKFSDILDKNFRPVQPINGRKIFSYEAKGKQ